MSLQLRVNISNISQRHMNNKKARDVLIYDESEKRKGVCAVVIICSDQSGIGD